jgi:hypothetical protein
MSTLPGVFRSLDRRHVNRDYEHSHLKVRNPLEPFKSITVHVERNLALLVRSSNEERLMLQAGRYHSITSSLN